MRETHRTDAAPAAIGPYSQAVRARGTFVFLSGQIPLTPSGEKRVSSIEEQTEQVCMNIKGLLGSMGLGVDNIAKTTIFLSSMEHFQTVNAVYGAHMGDQPPARSTVAVAGLPLGVDVEIECIAVIPD
ncbi:MAG: Rid family detoxifying hydrolase [Fimbriimonadaceae bacterium]|nr:Rid family detoxifying hydrolase [Fimbriimonadaceae bacterium]